MKASELIAKFQRMYREKWEYRLGAAEEGCVDCSGAFTYTLGLPHGSNTIYRKNIGWVTQTPVPGYAAFKTKKDGQEPEKYKNDGIGNVYHIGLVDDDGKHVLNAKGSKYGFCRDTTNGWDCYAPINGIDYGVEEMIEPLYSATVVTTNGNLNLRTDTSTKAQCITSVPKGDKVDVIRECGDWDFVRYGDISGYVMKRYLMEIEGSDDPVLTTETRLVNERGEYATLPGSWHIVYD